MRRIPAIIIIVALSLLYTAPASAQSMAPKAYIGLFKDDAVAVFDTANQRVTKTISIPPGPHGLVVTPDGGQVFVSSDGDSTVSVIDTHTDEVVDSIEVGKTPHGLAITPDGSQVLVAGFGTDRVVSIDTSTDQVAWQATVGRPHNIAITPDGMRAYAGSQAGNGALVELDLANGNELARMPLEHAPRALTVSPDGTTLLYTLSNVDAVQVLDTGSNQLAGEIPSGASPHHPLFARGGALGLVVSQGPGTLDELDVGSLTRTGSISVGSMPHWIALNGDQALVTNEGSGDISVVNLAQGNVVATVPVGNAPRKIVVQPSSRP